MARYDEEDSGGAPKHNSSKGWYRSSYWRQRHSAASYGSRSGREPDNQPQNANENSKFGSGSMRGNDQASGNGSYSQGNYRASESEKNEGGTGNPWSAKAKKSPEIKGTDQSYSDFINYNFGSPEESESGKGDA